MIKPTVGRIVWFWNSQPKTVDDQPEAGIVAFVHSDRCINLSVIDQNGFQRGAPSVTLVQEGDAFPLGYYATWMPYQVGQAKKAETENNAG